jgi:hypothetical protein
MTYSAVVSASFTRPANTTAYASGQLVANSTTAGSVAMMQFAGGRLNWGTGQVRRARVQKSSTGLTNAQFRLHLYRNTQTAANGDGAAWSTDGVANYIGKLDVTMDEAFTDGASGIALPTDGTDITFKSNSTGSIYGLLEARAAYAPASGETFTVVLEILQDD